MSNDIAIFRQDAVALPSQGDLQTMGQLASQLVPTGFLPKGIDTPQKAVAIMLKARELSVPAMYGLSNISIIGGKPVVSAEMMLALIYRDHGKQAIRVKSSDDNQCIVEYRMAGWPDVSTYAFTIEQAKKAGLFKNTVWNQYPAAMLRARCISAVARMAFPESIAGMYVPGELGESVHVDADGVITSADEPTSVSGHVIEPEPVQAITDTPEITNAPPEVTAEQERAQLRKKRDQAKAELWRHVHNNLGWELNTLNAVALALTGNTLENLSDEGLTDLYRRIVTTSPEELAALVHATQEQDAAEGPN